MPMAPLSSEAITRAESNPVVKLTLEDARRNIDLYRNRPDVGFDALSANSDLCADPEIAAVLCECATAVGRYDVAGLALRLADDPVNFLISQLFMAKGHPQAALTALSGRPADTRHLARYFGLRIRANAMMGRVDAAVKAAQDWSKDMPNSPLPFKVLDRALAQARDTSGTVAQLRAI